MKNLKQENGSVTLFVLVSMLFFVLFLVGVYMLGSVGEQTGISQTGRIKEIYEKDINQIDDVYATLTNQLIYYVTDKQGNEIPVPKGFSPITTSDQGTKETGFVIKNDKDGNEFVWVPVDKNTTYEYERVAFSKEDWQNSQTLDEQTKQIQASSNQYTETIPIIAEDRTELQSVKEYGGFYIGRYETGTIATTATTSGSGMEDTVVVQKGKRVYNHIKYADAKTKAEELYTKKENNVISRLCSSYAWDTTLKFIETKYPEYPINSEGGYNERSSLTTTGYDTLHPCNIYDMGGNVIEFTTETCDYPNYIYTIRGGWYKYSGSYEPAAYRTYNDGNAYENVGFRITLFL